MTEFTFLLIPSAEACPEIEERVRRYGHQLYWQPNVSLAEQFPDCRSYLLYSPLRISMGANRSSYGFMRTAIQFMGEGIPKAQAWRLAKEKIDANGWALNDHQRLSKDRSY